MAGVWPTSVAAPGGQWTTTCDVSISSESPLGKAAQAPQGVVRVAVAQSHSRMRLERCSRSGIHVTADDHGQPASRQPGVLLGPNR